MSKELNDDLSSESVLHYASYNRQTCMIYGMPILELKIFTDKTVANKDNENDVPLMMEKREY